MKTEHRGKSLTCNPASYNEFMRLGEWGWWTPMVPTHPSPWRIQKGQSSRDPGQGPRSESRTPLPVRQAPVPQSSGRSSRPCRTSTTRRPTSSPPRAGPTGADAGGSAAAAAAGGGSAARMTRTGRQWALGMHSPLRTGRAAAAPARRRGASRACRARVDAYLAWPGLSRPFESGAGWAESESQALLRNRPRAVSGGPGSPERAGGSAAAAASAARRRRSGRPPVPSGPISSGVGCSAASAPMGPEPGRCQCDQQDVACSLGSTMPEASAAVRQHNKDSGALGPRLGGRRGWPARGGRPAPPLRFLLVLFRCRAHRFPVPAGVPSLPDGGSAARPDSGLARGAGPQGGDRGGSPGDRGGSHTALTAVWWRLAAMAARWWAAVADRQTEPPQSPRSENARRLAASPSESGESPEPGCAPSSPGRASLASLDSAPGHRSEPSAGPGRCHAPCRRGRAVESCKSGTRIRGGAAPKAACPKSIPPTSPQTVEVYRGREPAPKRPALSLLSLSLLSLSSIRSCQKACERISARAGGVSAESALPVEARAAMGSEGVP